MDKSKKMMTLVAILLLFAIISSEVHAQGVLDRFFGNLGQGLGTNLATTINNFVVGILKVFGIDVAAKGPDAGTIILMNSIVIFLIIYLIYNKVLGKQTQGKVTGGLVSLALFVVSGMIANSLQLGPSTKPYVYIWQMPLLQSLLHFKVLINGVAVAAGLYVILVIIKKLAGDLLAGQKGGAYIEWTIILIITVNIITQPFGPDPFNPINSWESIENDYKYIWEKESFARVRFYLLGDELCYSQDREGVLAPGGFLELSSGDYRLDGTKVKKKNSCFAIFDCAVDPNSKEYQSVKEELDVVRKHENPNVPRISITSRESGIYSQIKERTQSVREDRYCYTTEMLNLYINDRATWKSRSESEASSGYVLGFGILRGSHLIVFIVGLLVLLWAFNTLSMFSDMDKWLKRMLPVIIAATIAHSGVAKSSFIAVAEIASIFILYNSMTLKDGSSPGRTKIKKFFAWILAAIMIHTAFSLMFPGYSMLPLPTLDSVMTGDITSQREALVLLATGLPISGILSIGALGAVSAGGALWMDDIYKNLSNILARVWRNRAGRSWLRSWFEAGTTTRKGEENLEVIKTRVEQMTLFNWMLRLEVFTGKFGAAKNGLWRAEALHTYLKSKREPGRVYKDLDYHKEGPRFLKIVEKYSATGWDNITLPPEGRVLVEGSVANEGMASGNVKIIIQGQTELKEIREDTIIVSQADSEHLEEAIKRAKAVIIDEGDSQSTSAGFARQHDKPCIVGAGNAITALADGNVITVYAKGESGKVFEGKVEERTDRIPISWKRDPDFWVGEETNTIQIDENDRNVRYETRWHFLGNNPDSEVLSKLNDKDPTYTMDFVNIDHTIHEHDKDANEIGWNDSEHVILHMIDGYYKALKEWDKSLRKNKTIGNLRGERNKEGAALLRIASHFHEDLFEPVAAAEGGIIEQPKTRTPQFEKNIQVIGAYNAHKFIKDIQLSQYDLYLMSGQNDDHPGQNDHRYAYAAPFAPFYTIGDPKKDDPLLWTNWTYNDSGKQYKADEMNTLKEFDEIDEKHKSIRKHEDIRAYKFYDPLLTFKPNAFHFTEHNVIEWRYYLDQVRFGFENEFGLTLKDYLEIMRPEIGGRTILGNLNFKDVRKNPDNLVGTANPSFDRNAMLDPGKLHWHGRKNLLRKRDGEMVAFSRGKNITPNPYPGLSTAGMSKYMAYVYRFIKEKTQRKLALERLPRDSGAAPPSGDVVVKDIFRYKAGEDEVEE